jgi:hypothetical protein
MEVHLWVSWNRVVNHYIKLLKGNSTSRYISKNKSGDLALLNLLNSLAQLDLRNVANKFDRWDATLLENHVSEISVRWRVTENDTRVATLQFEDVAQSLRLSQKRSSNFVI